jgi:hypothetical protein
MDTALVTMWKAPYPGREQKALEFAAESADFWGKQATAGRCTAPEWFFFPNGIGMWMVKGDRAELDALVSSDEARRLLVRGNLLLDDWQYTLAETGSAAERFMTDYAAALSTL